MELKNFDERRREVYSVQKVPLKEGESDEK